MKLKPQKIIIKDNNKYIIIATTEYKGKTYAFSNKIYEEKDEVTDEYTIFTSKNNIIENVNNQELIYTLLPIFQKQIRKNVEKIINEYNE
ncbi:MAG: hypothetical protein IKF19_00090 [Bacilli bacterium]|nr:hypothetical protein [Bacilli bacterium]